MQASSGVVSERRPPGADIMITRLNEKALIVECKYSADTGVVAQKGYEQAFAYATEAKTSLVREVTAVVIGPKEAVRESGFASSVVVRCR